MTGPVIVGVDGTPTSQKAAETAARLATALEAPLHVISAYTQDYSEIIRSGFDQGGVSPPDDARAVAQRVAEHLDTSGITVTAGSAPGEPAEALIDYSDQVEAEMIVVGNQRMRGASRMLGSVANTLSHNAARDVHIANTYAD